MKRFRRCTRIFILPLLIFSVFVPMVLLSGRLKHLNTDESKEFVEDLSIIKHRTDAQKLSAIEQEGGDGMKEPPLLVYEDKNLSSVVSFSSSNEKSKHEESGGGGSVILPKTSESNDDARKETSQTRLETILPTVGEKETVRSEQSMDGHYQSTQMDKKLKEMKDQVIRAKAYLNFASPSGNSHLVKELKLRIKELERVMGGANRASELSRSSLQKMRAMEMTLLKASRVYPDCSAMVKKLRAMTYNAEDQVRAQRNQATYLFQLAGRTTPKGLHCLSMRLTAEYFALHPEERELPNRHKLDDPDLFHFAVFSDNVLACAVVVNSTISNAVEPGRIVIHIVTDSLNLPAISMWFLLNPPGEATIEIKSLDNFEWLSSKYGATLQKQNSPDPRFTSPLNHLRFYVPDIFPMLNKIVLLDHDVIVQRDLTGLWHVNLKGKVNGAIQTCQTGEPSFRRMDMFINFSDPFVARKFDIKACTWAFGMNLFDLQEWRRRDLIGTYHKYLRMGNKRPMWKAGSLPLGWVTFYNQTLALNRRWHLVGLGYESGVRLGDIEKAAVIHYDGILKPWLEIGLEKYKRYWTKYVDYDHAYLQQCNIHS